MARRRNISGADIDGFVSAHRPVASRASIAPGTMIGNWRIAAFLGRGGTSEAYRAVHASLPLQAAVKILVRDNPSAKVRFDRETQFLFENRNPSFPRYLGAGEFDGRPFVAVELLEPVELPHGDHEAAKFITAVAVGVAALHRKGFVHRDLKPQNIMRRRNGDAVIIDFGLLKEYRRNESSPRRSAVSVIAGRPVGVGTVHYSAPEQLIDGEATPASDVHALGVLANECFGGFPPRCWAKIVRRATSSIPGQRYASVAEFSRAVEVRHRAGRIAAALLCAAAVLLAAFGLRQCRIAHPAAFPLELDLGGEKHVFTAPIVLDGARTYFIKGPGIIDADISGPSNTLLRLKDCVVLNRCKYPANGLRYRLENGVYLNFKEIPEAPPGVSRRDYIEPYDGAFNVVAFGGPDSPLEYRRREYDRWRQSNGL